MQYYYFIQPHKPLRPILITFAFVYSLLALLCDQCIDIQSSWMDTADVGM